MSHFSKVFFVVVILLPAIFFGEWVVDGSLHFYTVSLSLVGVVGTALLWRIPGWLRFGFAFILGFLVDVFSLSAFGMTMVYFWILAWGVEILQMLFRPQKSLFWQGFIIVVLFVSWSIFISIADRMFI